MTNLTERLDKHLQSIREGSRVISDQEILELLKKPSSILKKALNIKNKWGETLYPVGLIDEFEENFSEGFNDSYVIEPVNYLKYCICKASIVESGITIDQAVKDIEKNVKESERLYKQELPEYNFQSYKNDLDPDDQTRKEAEELIRKGADPKKVLITGDDTGDEIINPIDFVIDSEPFARACGAIELANKIKSSPHFKRAKELENLIVLL